MLKQASKLRNQIGLAALLLCMIGCGELLGSSHATPSHAQNPMPSVTFIDQTPGDNLVPPGASGVVVEGTGGGIGGCAYNLYSIEQSTVFFLNRGEYTWTELTPQGTCGPIADYEQEVSDIISYVEGAAPSTAPTLWLGFMLDEESNYDVSVSDLTSLNHNVASQVAVLPGVTFWSSEAFSGLNDWSQVDFNNIIYDGYAAPIIATDYMVTLTNNYQAATGAPVLVTWSTVYPYPYDSETYDDGAITGLPYSQGGYYWDNEFVRA